MQPHISNQSPTAPSTQAQPQICSPTSHIRAPQPPLLDSNSQFAALYLKSEPHSPLCPTPAPELQPHISNQSPTDPSIQPQLLICSPTSHIRASQTPLLNCNSQFAALYPTAEPHSPIYPTPAPDLQPHVSNQSPTDPSIQPQFPICSPTSHIRAPQPPSTQPQPPTLAPHPTMLDSRRSPPLPRLSPFRSVPSPQRCAVGAGTESRWRATLGGRTTW